MKQALIILLAAGLIALTACSNEEDHESHEGASKVELNNGERWKADASTNQGIADMKGIMNGYHEGRIAGTTKLQKHLQKEFQEIFDQCSMEGEAHEQLHNYLVPVKELLGKLKTCEGTECDELVTQLEEHLAEYKTYFK